MGIPKPVKARSAPVSHFDVSGSLRVRSRLSSIVQTSSIIEDQTGHSAGGACLVESHLLVGKQATQARRLVGDSLRNPGARREVHLCRHMRQVEILAVEGDRRVRQTLALPASNLQAMEIVTQVTFAHGQVAAADLHH